MTTLDLKLLKDSVWSAHRGPRSGTGVGAGRARAIQLFELWVTRARTRRELAELDERMLWDIGVSRAQAWHEAQKPFWRP